MVWGGGLSFVWIKLLERPTMAFYTEAVLAFAISAIIELLSLPILVTEMIQLRVEKKASPPWSVI